MSSSDDRKNTMIRRIMRLTTPIHRWIYHTSKGRIGGTWATGRQPILLLTTTGRRSGKPRTNPVCYLEHEDQLILMGSHGGLPQHPAWYLNLTENPQVTVEREGSQQQMQARTAEGKERDRLWDIVSGKYPMYIDYQAGISREIPVVVLSPQFQDR